MTPSGVRFHEKSTQRKDLRVWLIAQTPTWSFLAEPVAAA
jgi:hypothetical protein